MEIRIIKAPIARSELAKLANAGFGNIVKAVVDISQEIMAIGGELHADEEVLLTTTEGSLRENTWGINLYPQEGVDRFVEFDSMINLKPAFGNRSRGVENQEVQEKIKNIVNKLIVE
ncbi:MAG: DUF5674 family protein [bacterium]